MPGQGSKGNPASKRMSNTQRKAKRANSWNRTQKKKEERKKDQKRREEQNRETRRLGGLTPWERAKQDARERRARLRTGG